jgi:hypothetical protein
MERLMSRLSFVEGMALIFERFNHLPRHIFSAALNYLIEEKARLPEEFEALDVAVQKQIGEFLHEDKVIGEAAVVDALVIEPSKGYEGSIRKVGLRTDRIEGMEPLVLLKALLESGRDDTALKRYLNNRWWIKNRYYSNVTEAFKVEDYLSHRGRQAHIDYWLGQVPNPGQYQLLPDLVADVYLANDALKYAALRKILTGEDGVLAKPEQRRELADTFLATLVDFEGQNGEDITTTLVRSLLEAGDQESLYQRLNLVLKDLILKQPGESHPYVKI